MTSFLLFPGRSEGDDSSHCDQKALLPFIAFRHHHQFLTFSSPFFRNLWGFHRIVKGENKGAYFHKHFLKGRYDLCHLLSRQGAKREREGLSPDVPDGEMSIANPTSNTSIPKSKSTEVRKKRKKIVIKKIKIQKAEKAAVGKPSAEVAIPMVLDDLLKERQLVQPQASKPATFEGCQFFLLDIAKGDDLLGGLTKSSNPQGKGATTDPTCPIEEMDLTTRSVFSSTSKRPIHLIPQSNMAISA